MTCVSNVTIDGSNCYKKCSGMIVTSYTQQEMEDQFRSELLSYLFQKDILLNKHELRGLYLVLGGEFLTKTYLSL